MTELDPTVRQLTRWLADGPREAPPDLLRAVLAEADAAPQRTAADAWGLTIGRFGGALVAASLVIVTGWLVVVALRDVDGVAAPRTDPAPRASASVPAPTARPLPSLAALYGSPVHPYTIALPVGWSVTSAEEDWPFGEPTFVGAPWIDTFADPDGAWSLSIRSTILPIPLTTEEWTGRYRMVAAPSATPLAETCDALADWGPIRIGGERGLVREDCGTFTAVVVVGERGFVFNLRIVDVPSPAAIRDTRALLDALAGSVEFAEGG